MRTINYRLVLVASLAFSAANLQAEDQPPPGAEPQHVRVNSQPSLAAIVGGRFDRWANPDGLLPKDLPGFKYLSGPADPGLSPKAAWRKPTVFRHEDSGVVVRLDCYRRAKKQAPAGVASTPFAALTEPAYDYEKTQFHNLPAAEAAAADSHAIAFRHGDLLIKVTAVEGDAAARKSQARAAAERTVDKL